MKPYFFSDAEVCWNIWSLALGFSLVIYPGRHADYGIEIRCFLGPLRLLVSVGLER